MDILPFVANVSLLLQKQDIGDAAVCPALKDHKTNSYIRIGTRAIPKRKSLIKERKAKMAK